MGSAIGRRWMITLERDQLTVVLVEEINGDFFQFVRVGRPSESSFNPLPAFTPGGTRRFSLRNELRTDVNSASP